MDTERIIPPSWIEDGDVIFLELDDDELKTVTDYIEIKRHIQEIKQLFDVFRYDMGAMLRVYNLNNSDAIDRNQPASKEYDDRIEINALLISFISAGKTLTDSLKVCIEKSNSQSDEFAEFLSKIYDSSFYYRLLVRMRDYAQHGHLPISVVDNKFCFDISQILFTPHFNLNKAVKSEMYKIHQQLSKQGQPAHQVCTLCVAEYTACIAEIYCTFYQYIQKDFLSCCRDMRALLKKSPEYTVQPNARYDGYLFYVAEEMGHAFDTDDDPIQMFNAFKDEAVRFYEDETRELKLLNESVRFIPLEPNGVGEDSKTK